MPDTIRSRIRPNFSYSKKILKLQLACQISFGIGKFVSKYPKTDFKRPTAKETVPNSFFKINETKFGKNEPPVSTKIVVVNCLQLNPVPMTPLGPFSYMIPQLLATID